MARSASRRRGRSKGENNDNSANSPTKIPNSNGVSSFHAPLIRWSEDESTWYEYGKDLHGRNDVLSSTSSTSPALIRRYRSMADSIYANELRLFKQGQSKTSNSDEQWVENTMRKGTLKDRIAAMSVTVSTDPLHKFYALDGLMSMVGCDGGKTNSRVAQFAAEALEDLFINTLLPPDRKLLTLAQRPLSQYENNNDGNNRNNLDMENGAKKKKKSNNSKKSLSPRILLLWRFEEMIKEKYESYLRQHMARTLQEGAELQKIATLRSAGNLLISTPEGEVRLLNMMVNKLGDPDKKTAAAAGHQLRLVLQEHQNMQSVIAREVQQLAHRPHLAPKALYNCIVFLNQLQLKRDEPTPSIDDDNESDRNITNQSSKSSSLPASLIKTYFRLFEVAVQQNKKKASSKDEFGGSMKSRLLSALLTGVNRAHPYLPEKDQDMEEHVDALYRIVHTAPPAACTQALMLLFHLAVGSQIEKEEDSPNDRKEGDSVGENSRQKDRFYRALYATLAKSNIITSGKHLTMYFNVLYKAMKYDTNIHRVHSFAKRLLSAMMHAPAPLVAASAYLLQEIASTHEGLRQSWEDIPDPESSAQLVLDDHKREPKAGIVNFKQLEEKSQQEKLQPIGNPPCWEISLLAHHFHPSVSKFVNDIGSIEYGGDPLQDFGLAPFLDKFAYRNPKSREKLMQQRQQNGSGTGSRRTGNLESRLELPMNDPSFLNKTDVNEQDKFFHRFFVERARRDELKGITRHNPESNENSDDDSIQDAAEDQAFVVAEESGGLDTNGKTFEEYEAMWETDDEEEAFVDSLAMSLMEDAAGGPADIDEDPADIDNWGDLYDDESIDKGNESISGSEDESDRKNEKSSHAIKMDSDKDSDADAFMEASDSDTDSKNDHSANESEIEEEQFIAGLGTDSIDGDSDSGDSSADGIFLSDDDDDSIGGHETTNSKKRKKDGNEAEQPVFADAEEYEAMIEKSFNDLKNASRDEADNMKNNDDEIEFHSVKKKIKSRRRRK